MRQYTIQLEGHPERPSGARPVVTAQYSSTLYAENMQEALTRALEYGEILSSDLIWSADITGTWRTNTDAGTVRSTTAHLKIARLPEDIKLLEVPKGF